MRSILDRKARNKNKKSNVMSPLNWMCGVCETGVLVVASKNHDNWLGPAAFWVSVAILIFYALMYVFYSMRDPDRLQTEEFNLLSQEMRFQISSSNGQTHDVKIVGDDQNQLLSEAMPKKTLK